MELAGRRVLITGASRGIGQALAERFTAAGARVAVVARSEAPLKELANRLGGTAYPADLGDREQVLGLIDRIEGDGGPIDVLVNNAGVDLTGSFLVNASEGIEFLFRVNLLTPIELCHQAIPRMLDRGGGHVVNVSSYAGTAVFPGLVAYSSSKSGLSQFTAGLRADLKGMPICTTLVELGPIPTEMLDNVGTYAPTNGSFGRFYKLHLLVDVPKEKVAADVVEAVRKDRRHVRHPKRAMVFPLLTESPRRTVEFFLTGVRHQED
ncbi:MAG: SDR family NAD(P)-dependent oxidoreductase [Acidimicrobiia bacterium]|nr:SDR family NAD(P)-dependent oxidoreductase [Acidimicrobiia bacterium]